MSFFTLGFSHFIFCFIQNKMYINSLIKSGYVNKGILEPNDDNKDIIAVISNKINLNAIEPILNVLQKSNININLPLKDKIPSNLNTSIITNAIPSSNTSSTNNNLKNDRVVSGQSPDFYNDFLAINHLTLEKDDDDSIYVRIGFLNRSDKVIRAIIVGFECFDIVTYLSYSNLLLQYNHSHWLSD